MIRKFVLALLLSLSLSAQAADVTMSITAGELSRLAAAVGKVEGFVDAQTPPQPRSATPAEVKAWVIKRVRQVIIDTEGAVLTKQATDAVVIPTFDPK